MSSAMRLVDTGETIYAFGDEFLVVCPTRHACAKVVPRRAEEQGYFAPRRLVCGACGLVREWQETGVAHHPGVDWYFHLPLWLSTPCCGEVLWAHNWRHLRAIEEYVAATLREKVRDPEHGWTNRSMLNRLPRWMKAAKNRDEVLKAIRRLREGRAKE